MPNYDFYMRGGLSLDTRQARQAGLQLQHDLNHLLSDVSLNIRTEDIQQANKDVITLQRNLNAAMNPTRGTIDLSMFQTQLKNSGKNLNEYAQSLKKYGDDGQQAFLSLTKAISSAEAPTTRLSQGIKNMGEQFKRTIGWQLSSSAIHGVMSTYSQAIGYAKELNRSLTDIRIVTGQSQAQMAQFAKEANVAAKNLSSTTTRYTDAALIYYQQGLSEKQVKDRADITIKMANVAGVSAEKASQQLTAIWNNFDNGTKSLEHYADVMVKLGAETASSTDEISRGVQKFAAIGNTVGLSYEYAASALATVTATTRESADTVGTSFRTLFSRLQGLSLGETMEDGTTLNKYSKSLDTIGVRIKETNGEMRQMDDILDDIGNKWHTLSKDTQIGLAQSIGGARQYSTFMALMDNWDFFQQNVESANNAAGSLQKQQEIYAEGWQAASNRVRASMEGIFDSVIDDKGVITLTNAFAGALDVVNGLSNGLGGLGGILTSVGGIMLSKYSKEIPRFVDEIGYNLKFMFNPKAIYEQQDKVFDDAITSINTLRDNSGIKKDQNGIIEDKTKIVLDAELSNREKQLQRRQEYLRVEHQLSETEKAEYQQRMADAEMWDNQVLLYAQQTQNAYSNLTTIKDSVVEESFDMIKDKQESKMRSFAGKAYDLTNPNQALDYQEIRAAAIREEAKKRYDITHQDQSSWVKKETDKLNDEISFARMSAEEGKDQWKDMVDNATAGLTVAAQKYGTSQLNVDPDAFNKAMTNFYETGKMSYEQREILSQGFSLLQEPLIDTSKNLGSLDSITSRLSKNFDKASTSTAALTKETLEAKNKTGKEGRTFTQDLDETFQRFLTSAENSGIAIKDTVGANGQIIRKNASIAEAEQALTILKDAMASGGKTESEMAQLISNFQKSYGAAMGAVEQANWERGLTPEQTADIIAKARKAGISEEDQKTIEFRRAQEEFEKVEHQTQVLETVGKGAEAAFSTLSALQAGSNLSDTLRDQNATGLQKVTTTVGAVGSAAMMAGSLTSFGGSIVEATKGATGLLGTAGGAIGTALANPAVAAALAAATTLLPMAIDWIDSWKENDEEKEERLQQEETWIKEDQQESSQRASNFSSTVDNYNKKYEEGSLAQKGTHEQTQAVREANEVAQEIIDEYGLTTEDYRRDKDTGLIEIFKTSLDTAQQSLNDWATSAENRNSAMRFVRRSDSVQNDQAVKDLEDKIAKQEETVNNKNYSWKGVMDPEEVNRRQLEYYDEKDKLNNLQQQLKNEQENNSRQIQESYYDTLNSIAASDGMITESERYAMTQLQDGFDQEIQQKVIDRIEQQYGGDANAYSLNERLQKAQEVFSEDEYEKIINSEEYKNLTTDDQKNQYLSYLTKSEALAKEYEWQIAETQKDIGKLTSEYKNISNRSMSELKEMIEDQSADSADQKAGRVFAEAQYNKAVSDLQKAIEAYTEENSNTAIVDELIRQHDFDLAQTTELAETMQTYGDTFGDDAAKAIYNASIKANKEDRSMLLDGLKEVDFSGSNLEALSQVQELGEEFGEQFTDVFQAVKKSFGGDQGIFKEIVKDKSIQKMLANFEKMGDIDAEAIVKATHSSSDLALAMELADANAGGLAAALEGVASGVITQDQVSNSLLAGLSSLKQIDSTRAEAFDVVDNFDKGRSVTDLTKFAGNLGKTVQYNLRNGLMFDEPMMNAWGELFGEAKRYELKQDLINWGSVNKKDIAKNFDEKYKAEKELMTAMQKNPYDFNAFWKYAFDTSQVDVSEKENDEWVKSGEDKEDTQNRSYNSVSEEEWNEFISNGYGKQDENGKWTVVDGLNNYDKAFAEQIANKVNKENEYKDKYVNIDGSIFKIGTGKRDVQWHDKGDGTGEWVHKDGDKIISTADGNNALFGYSYNKKGVIFNDYFEEQNMDYQELLNIMQLNMGLTKNRAEAMIAEVAAQNTTIQKMYGEGQIDEAVTKMMTAADKNGEYINADQMELLFNNSEELQAKYQGAGFAGWIKDYLAGKDIAADDPEYEKKIAEREKFKKQYVDFRGAKSRSYEDMDEALKANTGYDVTDRLKQGGRKVTLNKPGTPAESKIVDIITTLVHGTGSEATTEERTGFDLSDTLDQALAMGLSEEATYDALGDLIKETGGVLTETVRGVDGSIQTFSSESAAYNDWLKDNNITNQEDTAEHFSRFISEQEAIAKGVQEMATQAKIQAEYEKLYDENGNRRTNTSEEDGAEGDVEETDEEEDTEGDVVPEDGEEPDGATPADQATQEPVSNGAEGTTSTGGSGGSGGGKSQDRIRAENEAKWLDKLGAYQDKDGNYRIDFDPPKNEGERQEQISAQAALDRINHANNQDKLAEGLLNAGFATGKNQEKIKKHYASGRRQKDNYEGLAQVGELGPELSIDKNGNTTILGVDGPTYAYVKKDDIIFDAKQTKDILRTTPDLEHVPGFYDRKNASIDSSSHGVSSAYIDDNIWNGYGGTSGGNSGGAGGEEDDWEPDRYVVILEQLQDLQREYARLSKAKERAYGADKIKALDAEIAKTNELIKAQEQYISEIRQFLDKDIQKLKDQGVWDSLILDKNGVIRNFDEISEKYKKAAEEGDEAAAKSYEAIMKYMETNNLLEEQMDALIDIQWQLMDARIQRITTKVDIKVAVDDTDLQYLSYQLNKINDEAYDVAKALSLIGDSMEVNLNKVNAYRQGLSEALTEAFTEIGLAEDKQNELLEKIESGTLTQEDLDNFEISPDHSQGIMDVLLEYRQQLITVNEQLDQLRDQVTSLVVRHFTDFTQDVNKQTSLINTYTNTLQTYANLTKLLNGRFQGDMDKILKDINASIAKNAKDSIKNTEILVQAAELKYKELNEMYLAAQELGDQATLDKVADARETAYKELQEANNKFASAWMSANESFLKEFNFGVETAVKNFQQQLSPLFGTVEALSTALERQNTLNEQYVNDYEKYYELNKMNRDLQTAIDETDNVNSKKALAKLQEEINKEKAAENQMSKYDLEVLKNKVELEKARLALDEAKNAKSTVTLSRDQDGNWGYVYTAEEDKVAKAEQDYEDKLYEYQQANKDYLDDLQTMVVEAQNEMVSALSTLDVNDPNYEAQKKAIIDSYVQTIAYVKQQMTSTLGNQEDSRLVALERYDLSMINLKNDFEDLSLSFITGEKSLEGYFATLENSLPQLLAELNKLEDAYDENIADINDYVTGNKNIADYMNENMDTLVNKSEEANQKIQGLYDTMVDELADVNKEVADIYNNWLPHIMEMTTKNELLAESISKIQHELSDLSEVEVPPVLQGTNQEHPEGYTENDYGVIRKLTEDEIKLREEIAKEIQKDDKGIITNYDELKEKWYEEPPKEGEEDKRDADKKAKWELLQKLIGYGAYGDPTAKQTIGLTGVWETIQSNAAAMYKAAETMAQGFKGSTLMVEQTVHINADFSGVTDRNEIQEAFNNLINEAAQYAYRRS